MVINPKSLNAITLRSGQEIGTKKMQFKEDEDDEEPIDEEIEVESPPSKTAQYIPKATQETSIQSKGPIEKGSPSKSDEMPKCAKFLKDLYTNKRKYRHSERIQLGSSVSAIFKPQLPIKCKDWGSYTIPCIHALKDASVMLGLADRTVRHPKGFLEDVLVKTFFGIAQTIINVKDGVITMGFRDQQITFNIYNAMSQGTDDKGATMQATLVASPLSGAGTLEEASYPRMALSWKVEDIHIMISLYLLS
ncbi:uncharacterized protein LOC114715139 [Neltuma alba]|uniref:uncharacterized protein LOC114715139 n=1 Tax=Neltuma alba TaxID=207710 RepID=UPI0010A2C514|nr:uncharacterized protein LOC114715139 [Prosopis alba]